MITLEKLAGYQDDSLMDKVAEAMDYLAAHNIDPIGGLTALMNIDADGNVLDEKVASELDKLAEEQIEALTKVAEFLAGEDPSAIAETALAINDEAFKLEKVAEAMDYLESNGIDPESAFIIAANVTPEGYFADEKVANDVAEAGFTDEDFEKIAEAIKFLTDNGIDLEEGLLASEIIKEAVSASGIQQVGKNISAYTKALKQKAKGLWNSYKDALTSKGVDKVKARIKKLQRSIGQADKSRKN